AGVVRDPGRQRRRHPLLGRRRQGADRGRGCDGEKPGCESTPAHRPNLHRSARVGSAGDEFAPPDPSKDPMTTVVSQPRTEHVRWGSVPDSSVATKPSSEQLEQHRSELTAYCYRMLGSPFEAEDAVQETLIRAWRGLDRFEGRAALRSWLYRIATNVCLDMVAGRERRARPMDLGPSCEPIASNLHTLPETTWLQPVPDAMVADPAELAISSETIKLAFVAALQHLPPRQRAVLILREVLRWQATEVAELLETTVASVNSALQRARGTLNTAAVATASPAELSEEDRSLLARYVEAFQDYDIEALTAL